MTHLPSFLLLITSMNLFFNALKGDLVNEVRPPKIIAIYVIARGFETSYPIPTPPVYFDYTNPVVLTCVVDGYPTPQAVWTNRRGRVIVDDNLTGDGDYTINTNSTQTSLKLSRQYLSNINSEDFTCGFTNNLNQTDSETFWLRDINNLVSYEHLFGYTFSALVCLILISLLARAIHLNRKQRKRTRMARERILQGDPDRMNPDAPLEDQVVLLPYDSKWEFPRNKLVLGKQLGVGQFGVVVEARALGTIRDLKDHTWRTVAVKMAKSSLDPTALESLASELKIMIHLGPHLNVVNLLGACTKNVIAGELVVIEEFCRYGNLHGYLLSSRQHFVNELVLDVSNNAITSPIAQKNDELFDEADDQNQYTDAFSRINNSFRRSSALKMLGNKVTLSMPKNDKDNSARLEEIDGYVAPSVDMMDNGDVISGRKIRTRDLVFWSFQIASGMDHLANKKVIHGDLAARNILLAEGNVVKIADFGLSRRTKYSKDGNYLKKGEEALPVKWMAIESLIDRIFSTQSDVWSYGVLLWEIFTLAQMPYAGIPTLDDLIRFLRDGQRLEKPALSSDLIDDLMARCWEKEPCERPTFNELERAIGNMLGEDVQHHYNVMNSEPYMNMNYTIRAISNDDRNY